MQATNESRRNFLKNAALAGLAAIAAPPVSLVAGADDKKAYSIFLFQGDSITDGNRGRNNDPNHIMGHGYAFSIASRAGARFPEKSLRFFNRGISGNTLPDLAARWQQDALDIKPDVLSLLIGINDTELALKQKDAEAAAKFEAAYRKLLQQTRAQMPGCLLVLCEPFIAPVGRVQEAWTDWQSQIQKAQQTVRQLATEHHAVFVPLQKVFDDAARKAPPQYWIWDGIHPTVAGHELIAAEWLKQVSRQVRFLKKLL